MPRPGVSPLRFGRAKKTRLDKDIQKYIRYQYNHGLGDIIQTGTGIVRGIVGIIKAKKEAKREEERKKKEADQKRKDEYRMIEAVSQDEIQDKKMQKHMNRYSKENAMTGQSLKNPIYDLYDQKTLQSYEPGAARVDYVWVPDQEYYNSLGYDLDKHEAIHEKAFNGSQYRRELIYNQEWEKTMDDNFVEEDAQAEANGGQVEYYKDAGKDGKLYAFRKVTYHDADGTPHVEVQKLADIGTWESAADAEANSKAYIESLKGTETYDKYLKDVDFYNNISSEQLNALKVYDSWKHADDQNSRRYVVNKNTWDKDYASKYTEDQMEELAAKYKAAGYKLQDDV